ncbi:hypothetical protein NW768_011502 [Fusarium equiseti]|uniref:Uncharacterized protein n=1 Tax=Fusarium equiseti TaxID=61235 RepID=A0ABQ8QWR1_FUSEQ|nr:hypothetical protein NW768_011502 [Fusarium equiseti]
MISITLVLSLLIVCIQSSPQLHRASEVCGSPDKIDYTLVQDPFLGDIDYGQPGITFTADYGDESPRWFMVYQNAIDFKPYRAMKIPSNITVFIDLTATCHTFSGRLVRGADINFNGEAHNLGTWAEVNWGNYPLAYGGVSVIEGNSASLRGVTEELSSMA